MEQEVYADLLFLVNFSMDFLCAYLTASLLHRRVRPWRLISASVLGGLYAVAALFLPAARWTTLSADLAVCLLMCALLFVGRGVPPRFFALSVALYVGVSMAMGGMMTALFRLLNRAGLSAAGLEAGEDGLSAWLFALLAGISTLAGLRGSRLLRQSAARRFARLTVTVGERSVEVQALIDNGNLCRDPISGKPVIFLDPRRARTLIGEGELSPDMARRFRMIPIETVSGRQLRTAYLPDRMMLTDGGGSHEIEALIAPAEAEVGRGLWGAIVPAELVT